MEFRVKVQSDGDGWRIQVLDPQGQPVVNPAAESAPVRRLSYVEHHLGNFPQPPSNEIEELGEDSPLRTFCTLDPTDAETAQALRDTYARIIGHNPREEEVARFGRYLFAVLFGEQMWGQIRERAGEKTIELSLGWGPEAGVINRLPWEMMRGESGFLAESDVTIIRRVIGADYAVDPEIKTPPRVLFVVGSDLHDDRIRPGAEYLGLLRNLRHKDLNLRLKTHLLLQASPEKLESAIKGFRPTVVHIICHGGCDANGKPYLELREHDNPAKCVVVYARDLLQILRTGPMPQIVVLNACYSAKGSNDLYLEVGQVASPLAVDLVLGRTESGEAKGVPIVVGMAGQVSDRACRLFTRRFYEALLQGENIAHASGQGRRLGIKNPSGKPPASSVDWALPTLFLADSVKDVKINLQDAALEERWGIAASEYERDDYPAFCDRLRHLTWYHLLMADREVQHTAAPVQPGDRREFQTLHIVVKQEDNYDLLEGLSIQYGRTWLLRQMAAQAARDGHVPCLLNEDVISNEDWPKDEAAVRDALMRTATLTATRLGLDWTWTFLPRLIGMQQGDDLPPDFPDEEFNRVYYMKDPKDADVVATAFRLDLMALLDAAKQQRPEEERKDTKLVLLVDDVHRMGLAAAQLLLKGFMGDYGLRHVQQHVRMVVASAWTAAPGQDDTVNYVKDWSKARWIKEMEIEAFKAPEDRLAYRQFLLHWRKGNNRSGELMPLSPLAQAPNGHIEFICEELNDATKGIPSWLESQKVAEIVDKIHVRLPEQLEIRFLTLADDDRLLEAIEEIGPGDAP